MAERADVVIVGGGVIGSAIAYFLATDAAFDGRVVIVERDPTYRRASSALSASSIRQQFSTPENIRMSQFGFGFLRDAGEILAVDGGPAVDIGLVERGYLYLAAPTHATAMREVHGIQRAEGADVELLEPAELGRQFPWMSTDGIALGSLGRSGEGWFDGDGLTRALRRRAVSSGVEVRAGAVVGLRMIDGRVAAAELDEGTTIACGVLVDAAGPWAHEVATMAGVSLPVEARRRCVFVFAADDPPFDPPLVIDPSGAWFRPEGGSFIGAIPPPLEEDRPDLPLEVDPRLWDEALWPTLANRVPAFDRLRRTGAWAGYYEVNTFDHNAILGRHPAISNLLFANGFSGHGIQHAPAVGRGIAELIVHDRYVSLDLGIFGFDRIGAGRRVEERNVIG